MRILVTGSNGFIGSRVVVQLLKQGHAVHCFHRSNSDTRRLADLPVTHALGDVRDPASLQAAAAGVEAIMHLAGPSSWTDIQAPGMRDSVVGGTRHVLEVARGLGGLRTVFVSSVAALGGSATPVLMDETYQSPPLADSFAYAHAKREAEQLCQQAACEGLPVVVVNPAEVYGPQDGALVTAGNLMDFARSYPVLVCSGGTSVVHVEDVAQGVVAALLKGRSGERYVLGGDNLTIRQLAALTLSCLQLQKPIVTVPNGLLRGLAKVGSALKLPLPFHPAVIPYATRYWFVSNQKACRELGVSFRSARDVIQPTVEWLRHAGHVPSLQGGAS